MSAHAMTCVLACSCHWPLPQLHNRPCIGVRMQKRAHTGASFRSNSSSLLEIVHNPPRSPGELLLAPSGCCGLLLLAPCLRAQTCFRSQKRLCRSYCTLCRSYCAAATRSKQLLGGTSLEQPCRHQQPRGCILGALFTIQQQFPDRPLPRKSRGYLLRVPCHMEKIFWRTLGAKKQAIMRDLEGS